MKVTRVNIKAWAKMGQRGAFFAIAMPEIAKEHDNIKLLTADLAVLSGMDRFISAHPDKFLNVGIAEQNMIGIAAGLSMDGYSVFATTYASFIAVRSLEHVRQHLAHMKCNVKLIGSAAGVTAAKSGVSHHATEDIAFIRALPNMVVLSAADSLEAIKMAQAAANYDGPVYIRLSGGINCPVVYTEDYDFEIGKMIRLNEGEDAAVFATGLMVKEALDAADILADEGLTCEVINVNTIKPLDTDMLDDVFSRHKVIFTAEEHNIAGGMGSAIAEYKATKDNTPRQVFIGFGNAYPEAGNSRYVWEQAGLTAHQIADTIRKNIR